MKDGRKTEGRRGKRRCDWKEVDFKVRLLGKSKEWDIRVRSKWELKKVKGMRVE